MKLIIFDIDGTLTNTVFTDDFCYRNVLKELTGVSLSRNEWSEIKLISSGTDSGITYEILRRYVPFSEHNDLYSRIKHEFIQALFIEFENRPDRFTEITGSKDFIGKLSERKDVTIGYATGSWRESGVIKLRSIGIEPESTFFSNSDESESRTEIIRNVIDSVLETHEIDEIFYFGDGDWDAAAARNLGIKFIGVDFNKTGRLIGAGVSEFIYNYNEISLLEKYLGINLK